MMTAPHIIDPASVLGEALSQASPEFDAFVAPTRNQRVTASGR